MTMSKTDEANTQQTQIKTNTMPWHLPSVHVVNNINVTWNTGTFHVWMHCQAELHKQVLTPSFAKPLDDKTSES